MAVNKTTNAVPPVYYILFTVDKYLFNHSIICLGNTGLGFCEAIYQRQ